jgi:hypothetical protein
MTVQPMKVRFSNYNKSPDAHLIKRLSKKLRIVAGSGLAADGRSQLKPFFAGPGHDMPRRSSSVSYDEILYYKIVATATSPTSPSFSYDSASGRATQTPDIDDFMGNLINGNPPGVDKPLYNPNDPINIVLKYPCYVVIHLSGGDPNVFFAPSSPALETQGDFSTGSEPYKYCNLDHYDQTWDMSTDTSTSEPCYCVKFLVTQVDEYNPQTLVNDLFNINFQTGYYNGAAIITKIDPALKNRGPHGSSIFSKVSKAKPRSTPAKSRKATPRLKRAV